MVAPRAGAGAEPSAPALPRRHGFTLRAAAKSRYIVEFGYPGHTGGLSQRRRELRMANSYASKLGYEHAAGWLPRPIQRPSVSGIEPLAALRAKLAALVRESTTERLPAGHWVVICPEDLLGHLAEATSHVDEF